MPNWASNTNLFYSKNKCIINDLYDKLSKWSSIPKDLLNPNNWDGSAKWLGNILLQAGLDEAKVVEGYYGKCRGEIAEISCVSSDIIDGTEYYFFAIYTETAWCQMSKMWLSLFDNLYGEQAKEIYYSWLSEEPNCVLYERHDTNKMLRLIGYSDEENYLIESYVSPNSTYVDFIPRSTKFITEQEAYKITSSILNKKVFKDNFDDSLDEINELLYTENTDFYMHINKYEDVELLTD